MTTMKVIPKNVFAELPSTCDLSAEQMKFYDDNGYLVVKELIDFTSLYSYKQRFLQISKGLVDRGNMTVVRDSALVAKGLTGEAAINKVQDILHDDIFASYVEHPRLLHVVSQLIGDDLCAIHSMFINKPPSTGRHPPHQDMHYFPLEPPHYITASWTAVDHVTVENGSLYVIPGSHKAGVIHQHGNLPDSSKMYHGILDEATLAPPGRQVPVEMSPGDTVFFHPLLVHGSGPNVTNAYRKSISCHYVNSARCRLRDVTGSQEVIAREVEAEAARRGARGATFKDIFRYRSKQVKGFKSQL